MWSGEDFCGAKIALLHNNDIIAYLRDDKPSIPFPGLWDLPGGGREGDESPIQCALRELEEEFGIKLPASRVHYVNRHPSAVRPGQVSYFCVAFIERAEIEAIRFGDEGQYWLKMTAKAFVEHPRAIPMLQANVQTYLDAGAGDASVSPE